ncbi:hypothetical protein Pcinc_035350 [Petrolisthes cinctipes]|uniref:Uncharacterized protein n=1 Tax=Petrolisthes cinctipes TaxID=88211 RepID=A0AAE1C0Z2_PETCI|nr:hypothetical protein Pcinc_035350 [Petrolisthes cinctipes]
MTLPEMPSAGVYEPYEGEVNNSLAPRRSSTLVFIPTSPIATPTPSFTPLPPTLYPLTPYHQPGGEQQRAPVLDLLCSLLPKGCRVLAGVFRLASTSLITSSSSPEFNGN